MQPEEWELKEYNDIEYMRRGRDYTYGTKKVPFKTIRKILREAEKQGKKTLTHSELKQKIIKECGATEEEAETAIHAARQTFKIRPLDPQLRKIWKMEPFKGEIEYYWSGTTSGYPPLTHQDQILTLITKKLKEAETQGKQTLTHQELIEGAYKNFEDYRWNPKSITKRLLEREFVETLIEDAQELLLITAKKENGKTTYKLNHQILQAIETGKTPKTPHKKHKKPTKNKK